MPGLTAIYLPLRELISAVLGEGSDVNHLGLVEHDFYVGEGVREVLARHLTPIGGEAQLSLQLLEGQDELGRVVQVPVVSRSNGFALDDAPQSRYTGVMPKQLVVVHDSPPVLNCYSRLGGH
jgi:hypothetical protein